jgi:hypothetical protein
MKKGLLILISLMLPAAFLLAEKQPADTEIAEETATTSIEMAETSGPFCTTPLTLSQTKDALLAGTILFEKPDPVTGSAKITNNTDCPLPISLAVFTIDDPADIADPTADGPGPDDITFQTLYDSTKGIMIDAKSSETLTVSLPSCNFQMDIYYADNYPTNLDRGNLGEYFLDDMQGRSYAVNMAAFGGNSCPPPPTATLTIVKTVINNNGGTKGPTDFSFEVSSGSNGFITHATSGIPYTLFPGSYTASERFMAGYTSGAWGGDCNTNGSVTLNAGDNKTCTITNDDEPQGGGNGTTTPREEKPRRRGGGGTRITPPIASTEPLGTGGGSDGSVLGASTQIPPQFPNTGRGGNASGIFMVNVALATLICLSCGIIAAKRS